MDIRWRMTTCAAVALVTTVLAGCSGGTASPGASATSTDPQVLSALRKAATATEKAGSAQVDGTSKTGTSSSARHGVLDWSRTPTSGRLTVTGTGAGETRSLRKAAYVRVSDSVAASMGGRHWLKYGAAAAGTLAGQLGASDPAEPVKELIASGDVRKVGTEQVRGVKTTHYLGTTASQRIELWIDKRGLVIKSLQKDDGSAGSTTTTAYYAHYGTRVVVKAPPAADTVDYTALLKAQSASPSASAS
jgi:hypothetical protein